MSTCATCDDFGVLDGLELCPADCDASRRFVMDHSAPAMSKAEWVEKYGLDLDFPPNDLGFGPS
jgi:hypothetical protein